MDRISVSSSNVISVGYDGDSMTLEIEFNNGIYQYYDVPEDIFQELINASSIGSFIHQNIKNNYSYSPV